MMDSLSATCLSFTHEPVSRLYDHLESTIDEALAVEWHRVRVGLQPRVSHYLLPGFVAHLARRPRHPREHHRFVRLAVDRHRKGRQLALGHVIAPALDDVQRAVLPEYQ